MHVQSDFFSLAKLTTRNIVAKNIFPALEH